MFGYPVSGQSSQSTLEYGDITTAELIITPGIISGTKDTSIVENGEFVDISPNYFTSAGIDAGNSGGIAVAKVNGSICEIGIPTWVNQGSFENLGIIQSFQHINDSSPYGEIIP